MVKLNSSNFQGYLQAYLFESWQQSLRMKTLSRRDFHKRFQINEKERLANRSRDLFVFVGFFVTTLIPEQQFAWTRVMHADLTRIALFWASKLEWISMNLAHTGQTWRVSLGFHILGVDIIRLGTIARMRKKKWFIFSS